MSDKSFDFSEFIEEKKANISQEEASEGEIKEPQEEVIAEVDIQKAVVEELAAEKVALHEKFSNQEKEIAKLKEELAVAQGVIEEKKKEAGKKDLEIEKARKEIEETKKALEKAKEEIKELDARVNEKFFSELQALERNPNMLALIDRDPELPDRFFGETRDHVLEVINQARQESEKSGRLRRAQILEAVLVANEPCGELKKKREELEKVFEKNCNIINGEVINKLEELGIKYKEGQTYLLPSEILSRNY